jgi:hypothetical protein
MGFIRDYTGSYNLGLSLIGGVLITGGFLGLYLARSSTGPRPAISG